MKTIKQLRFAIEYILLYVTILDYRYIELGDNIVTFYDNINNEEANICFIVYIALVVYCTYENRVGYT